MADSDTIGQHSPFEEALSQAAAMQLGPERLTALAYVAAAAVVASIFTGDWKPLTVVATVGILYHLLEHHAKQIRDREAGDGDDRRPEG